MTVSAWIRTTTNDSESRFIVHDFRSAEGGYKLRLKNGRVRLTGRSEQGGPNKHSGNSQVISDNQWHFITGTLDANDTWSIYVDGMLSNAKDYTPTTAIDLTNTRELFIGKNNGTNPNRFFNGDIRDVAIWNVAKDGNNVLIDFTAERPSVSQTGLVGYYPLNEGSGVVASDLSSTAIDGTITNENWSTYEEYSMVIKPTYTTTYENYLAFDGNSDVVNATADSRGITNQLTIESWYRSSTLSSLTGMIVNKYDAGNNGYCLFVLQGKVYLKARNDNFYQQIGPSNTMVADGVWHHVSAVITQDGKYQIYVDGTLDTENDFGMATGSLTTNDPLTIGDGLYNTYDLTGGVKDVSVWNTAKTGNEVYFDYKKQSPTGNEANLVAYFPLNEGSGTVATDNSSTAINGTINGATWQQDELLDSSYLALDSVRLENRNSVAWQFRMSDPLTGRMWSVDPLTSKYPYYSPYSVAGNTPIWASELEGLEPKFPEIEWGKHTTYEKSDLYGYNGLTRKVDGWWVYSRMDQEGGMVHMYYNHTKTKWVHFNPIPLVSKANYADGWKFILSIQGIIAMGNESGHEALDGVGLVPVLGELADGINATWYYAQGDNVNGTLSAAAMVPFLGWTATAGKYSVRTIKALKGVGGEALSQISKKINNISEHLTKLDVTGAMKDIMGKPVLKQSGEAWDHLKEVTDALGGVKKQLNKLNKGISDGSFTGEVLEQAKEMRSTLQKTKDNISSFLNNIEKKVND